MKQVAYNPKTRRYEEVFPEDEVPAECVITLYWSEALKQWVTVPED